MRRRAAALAVDFYTDPLCPWSWAMEALARSLQADRELAFRSVQTGWLRSLAAGGLDSARAEWAAAAAKTGARIDPAYWDRVAPATSLVAAAAVKAAGFQGRAKGEAYLSALRRAAFEGGENVASFEVLVGAAESLAVIPELFRGDLGVGRYDPGDVGLADDPGRPLSEAVWWFGRRKMLRAWEALAADIRAAERRPLRSPAFLLRRGKHHVVLEGFTDADGLAKARRSLLERDP